MKGYYTKKEVARLFEISQYQVTKAVEDGRLPEPVNGGGGHGKKQWWKASDVEQILKGAA